MVRKQVGALVDKNLWTALKTHCVRNEVNIVDIAGKIIEGWVIEHCDTTVFETDFETESERREETAVLMPTSITSPTSIRSR